MRIKCIKLEQIEPKHGRYTQGKRQTMKATFRTHNSTRNVIFSLGSYLFSFILSFIVRTVFIYSFGTEYLGVKGLFANIMSVLAFFEVGMGAAIVFRLYTPIAENDHQRINQLMRYYRIAYRWIALIVASAGLMILPFLRFILGDVSGIEENLHIVFLLFLLSSVTSYLLVYRKSLIIAHQQEHLISTVFLVYHVAVAVLQILVLVCFRSFYLFIIVEIAAKVAQNIFISYLCKRKHPYITEPVEQLPREDRRGIFKDVRALILYRMSDIVFTAKDSILLSMFVGLTIVGVYSNYVLIINAVLTLIFRMIYPLTASIGDVNATSTIAKQELVYKSVNFMTFWLYGMAGVCLYAVLPSLINVWIGADYLLGQHVLAIIIANFYMLGAVETYKIFRGTFGLFVQGQIRPVLATIINVTVSLILVHYLGIAGIFLGTLSSYLAIYIWYDPLVVYRHAFKKSPAPFYIRSMAYLATVAASAYLTDILCELITVANPLLTLIARAVVAFVFVNGVFAALFWRMMEFRYIVASVRGVFMRLRRGIGKGDL